MKGKLAVGYELEFFVTEKKQVVVPCALHFRNVLDAGKILVEARGEPLLHPRLAEVSLELAIEKLRTLAKQKSLALLYSDEQSITPAQMRSAMSFKCSNQKYTPEPEDFINSEVVLQHFNPQHYRAGLHVHFSFLPEYRQVGAFGPINMPRFIKQLDLVFKQEIKAAGRYPGAYRMKEYGFEYRSLPATTRVARVTQALTEIWPKG